MDRHASMRDILSGLVFVGVGVAFGVAAAGYEIGTAFRMGPGYFPLALAGALVVLGAAIAVRGLRTAAAEAPLEPPSWRAVALLTGAVVFFGATVRGLGLAPALFLTVFASALASRRNTPAGAAVLALGLTLFCILVFSVGLGVPLPLLGRWAGG